MPPEEAAGLYYNLGNAYFELDEFNLAVTAYLNALELDDSLPQAGYNLARVYIESGDVDKGVDELNRLLTGDPENGAILSTIGWAYYLLRDYERSYDVFKRILERTPSDENGLYNAGVIAWLLGEKDDSLGYYRRLYAENGDVETLYRIASIYIDLERWKDAVGALTEYIESKPEDSDAFYDLGIAFSADRLYGEALLAFERAIELDGNNPIFLFEKAVILLVYIENLDEGLKYLQLAIDAGFDDSERAQELATADSLIFSGEIRDFLIGKNLIAADPPLNEIEAEVPEESDGDSADSLLGEEPSPPKPQDDAYAGSKKSEVGTKTELEPEKPEETKTGD